MEFQWYKLYTEKSGQQGRKEHRSGVWEEDYLEARKGSVHNSISKKVDVERELIIARKSTKNTVTLHKHNMELFYTWKIILYLDSDIEIISYNVNFNDYETCLQDAEKCICENRYSYRKIICAHF